MPTKKSDPLPEPLRYLQPFANALAKLPPEELNEDVDATRLEAALRKRVRGLDEEAADAELGKDRDVLERWLEDKPDHPAHWIRGFLLSPDLAASLTRPDEPTPRGPEMHFEAPDGWKVKKVPFRLDLKAGKVLGSIMATDELGFAHMQYQWELGSKATYPEHMSVTRTTRDVSAGECHGRKSVIVTTAPFYWKRVNYLLRVPGGFVSISLGTTTGADFDESPFDAQLHTLQLSAMA